MKVVIFAGGLGTRLGEETFTIPKPMVKIGNYPIIWHIMKSYSHYGFNEFVILCGYKGEVIKDYFINYCRYQADITVDLLNDVVEFHRKSSENWKITLVDTGLNSMTGTRLRRAKQFLNERFLLTYGDGLSDVNINDLIAAHDKSGKIATLLAVKPEGRFGVLTISNETVIDFAEKQKDNGDKWINGGFFVVEPEIFDYIPDEGEVIFEQYTLSKLAMQSDLGAYKYPGFWYCMDTLKDKADLNTMWTNLNAPWKVWNDTTW
jgi:glucose-1-phosphate cytidylyltransferase